MGFFSDLFKAIANANEPDETSKATITRQWIENDSDYEVPKDTLRDLKKYKERADGLCGFDYTEIRRHRSSKNKWWLEGSNFDKAVSDLSSIEPFEHEIRMKDGGMPHVVEFIVGTSEPYSVGADGNRVPTLSLSSTKKGEYVTAYFGIEISDKKPIGNASVKYGPDGSIQKVTASWKPGRHSPQWKYVVERDRKTGELAIKSASYDGIEIVDEKLRTRQLEERAQLDAELDALNSVEVMANEALRILDLADGIGANTKSIRCALSAKSGYDIELDRNKRDVRFSKKAKAENSFLLVVNASPGYSQLRWWRGRGAPELEMEVSKGKITKAKSYGNYIGL